MSNLRSIADHEVAAARCAKDSLLNAIESYKEMHRKDEVYYSLLASFKVLDAKYPNAEVDWKRHAGILDEKDFPQLVEIYANMSPVTGDLFV